MDVGGVTLLGLHTARETYPTTAPVTATLTLHARDVASATLTLLLDGDPVLTTPLTLTGGVDEITVAVPAPLPPSRHTLIGRVEAAGLEHHRSHTFVYGTDVVDLVPASPYVNGSAGVTRTLRTRVYNRGRTASVTTTLQLWDGDPAGGGTLVGESAVSPLRPGASERLELA